MTPIEEAMKKAGIKNTNQLAKLTGIPYMTVRDITTGKRDIAKISADVLVRLAAALGITAEELYLMYMKSDVMASEYFEHFVKVNNRGDDGLTDDEMRLAHIYRDAPESLRPTILAVVSALVENRERSKEE